MPATTAAAAASAATRTLGLRAEVAQLVGELGIEAVLEADLDDIAVAVGTLRRPLGPLGPFGPLRALGPLPTGTLTAAAVTGGRRALLRSRPIAGRCEADLALVVDLLDDDLDLLTEFEHVLHGVDALAATELGDVHQTVAARQDVDERTELGDVHHAAGVGLAQLGLRRVEDGEDRGLGLFHAPGLDGTDGDDATGTVVVDTDVGTGLLLDRVDDLALRADHLADLVERDVDGGDLRSRLGHFVTRLRDAGVHDVEDLEAGGAGLGQRSGEHVGGDAVDLRVELQRRDGVFRAGDLVVHVAEGVLGTEDVGERDVLAAFVDETHGDTGHVALGGHAGIHQRQARCAHRGHRGGAVRRHHLGHEAQRVGEVLLVGDHRQDFAY